MSNPTQERFIADADADEVTNRLDTVYARESSELPPALRAAQYRALIESASDGEDGAHRAGEAR